MVMNWLSSLLASLILSNFLFSIAHHEALHLHEGDLSGVIGNNNAKTLQPSKEITPNWREHQFTSEDTLRINVITTKEVPGDEPGQSITVEENLEFLHLSLENGEPLLVDENGDYVAKCDPNLEALKKINVNFQSRFFKFRAQNNQQYSMSFLSQCGVHNQFIFDSTSDDGQLLHLWNTLEKSRQKLFHNLENDVPWSTSALEVRFPGTGVFFSPWGNYISIANGDHWDIAAHELGHAVYYYANLGQMGGGAHRIDECYSQRLALSEGWASYFSAWVFLELDASDPGFEFLVPRRAPIQVENVPADVCRGTGNEWRVMAFLWDLIDSHEDEEVINENFSEIWNVMLESNIPSANALRNRLIQRGHSEQRVDEAWNAAGLSL